MIELTNEIENNICDAIQVLIDASIQKNQTDNTIKATIISCTDALTGEYKIKYQDNTLTAYSGDKDVVYKKDTLVYVHVPNNNLENKKTILGAVDKNAETYVNSVSEDSTYNFFGTNCVVSGSAAFNSYHTETRTLYAYNGVAADNIIQLDLDAIREYISEHQSIYIAADFQTTLAAEQQSQGDYGITFALDFLAAGSEQEVTRYYTINVNNMTGNPYRFLQPTRQQAFFDIRNEEFVRVNSITAFVRNFPIQDETKNITDIYISNIILQSASKMDSNELAGYGISLTTPMGSVFTNANTESDTLPIAAQLKYRGMDIDDASIEFYWFVEDANINLTSAYYSTYGGLGWKCLNEKNGDVWAKGNSNYKIKFTDAIAQVNIFKCVAVYAGNIISKTIEIKNYQRANVTLVSSTGTSFVYGGENPIVTCYINGQEQPGYTYTWLQDGAAVTDVSRNAYTVNIGELSRTYTEIKCGVRNESVSIGTASITLSETSEEEDTFLSLSIVNGTQVFKYDENGVSPTSQANEVPLVLQPLGLRLLMDGNDVELENAEIRWEIPESNTLLVVQGADLTAAELYYDIASSYSYTKTDNQISVSVTYGGSTVTATTNFVFLKDGDPGTNGTSYVCKIVPNVASDVEMPDRIIYNTTQGRLNFTPSGASQQWVRAQLWENGELIFDNARGNSTFAVEWSILTNKYDYSTSDYSNLSIVNNTGLVTCQTYQQNQTNAANIIKVNVTYQDVNYCAYMPVVLENMRNSSYNITVAENSGFNYVTYSNDGQRPQYDNNNPFRIVVTLNDTDVSLNSNISYNWNIKGAIYQNSVWQNVNLLTRVTDDTLAKNEALFKPAQSYDGLCVNVAVECIVFLSGNEIGRVLIPIYFGINRYGLASLNGWDGNTIQTSAEGGFILSPQIGAGRKEDDNSFTGLVMGEVRSGSGLTSEVGLMGYNQGQRSIFLDAETGTAEFGVRNQGQIVIDPSDGRALIRSGNYQQGSSGMAIDLTTPEIIYGNGNFHVDEDGILTAQVGNLGEGSQQIHIGGSGTRSYLYSGTKNQLTSNTTGFYLGTDGFSLGAGSGQSAFQITPSGEVSATNITVQSGSQRSGRIELEAGSQSSMINFYYNNSRRGYIYGSANGLEIFGSPTTYVGGSYMDISANSLDISSSSMYIDSNRLYLTPGTLYASTPGGNTAPAVSGTFSLIRKTGCYVGGIGPVLWWTNTKVSLTFYNGILVDTGEFDDDDYNKVERP